MLLGSEIQKKMQDRHEERRDNRENFKKSLTAAEEFARELQTKFTPFVRKSLDKHLTHRLANERTEEFKKLTLRYMNIVQSYWPLVERIRSEYKFDADPRWGNQDEEWTIESEAKQQLAFRRGVSKTWRALEVLQEGVGKMMAELEEKAKELDTLPNTMESSGALALVVAVAKYAENLCEMATTRYETSLAVCREVSNNPANYEALVRLVTFDKNSKSVSMEEIEAQHARRIEELKDAEVNLAREVTTRIEASMKID